MIAAARHRILDASGAFVHNLSVPELRRAQLSFGAGWASEWAFTVGISIVAYDDGGARAVGLVALLRLSPSIVAGPFASTLADRFRRDRILVAIGLTRAASIGLAAILLRTGAPAAATYALAMVATTALTPFRAAHSALLPSLCHSPDELTSAMAVRGMLDSLSVLVGPLLSVLLLPVAGTPGVLAAAAVLSLLSATLLLGLTYEPAPRLEPDRTKPGLAAEMAGGFRAILAKPPLLMIFLLGTAQTFTRGCLNVFIVVAAVDVLSMGSTGVGVLNTAVGVGGVAGSLAASLLVGSRRLGLWFGVAVAAWGAPLVLIGAFPERAAALVLLASIGAANALLDVSGFTLFGRLIEDEVMARVFGVIESTWSAAVGIGGIVAAETIAGLGVRGALVALGAVCPLAAALAWPSLRRLDRTLVVQTHEIDVLRTAPMLRALSAVTIEHLAREVRHASIAEGAFVCVQGEPADAFYVIEEGEVDVIGDGRLVRVLGSGDHFGEIGLLRDARRTASVRARTPLLVSTLTRDQFVRAVSGHGAGARAAEEVIGHRLEAFRPPGVPG